MKHGFAFSGLFIALVLGFVLAGCSGPSVPGRERQAVGDGLLERSSPENVLFNLRLIYGEKDDPVNTIEDAHYWAERYRELFHPDFKFYFLPGDNPPDLEQDWWDIEDEVAAFDCLLVAVASGQVEDISLAWTVTPSVSDNRVDEESGEILHPDWKWIHLTSVLLDIVRPSGDIFRALNASTDFYFEADPADSTAWVITEWWDGTPWGSVHFPDVASGLTAPEFTTWGRLKGLFRCR